MKLRQFKHCGKIFVKFPSTMPHSLCEKSPEKSFCSVPEQTERSKKYVLGRNTERSAYGKLVPKHRFSCYDPERYGLLPGQSPDPIK